MKGINRLKLGPGGLSLIAMVLLLCLSGIVYAGSHHAIVVVAKSPTPSPSSSPTAIISASPTPVPTTIRSSRNIPSPQATP